MITNLWRWHPKVALRYLPIVKKIKDENLVDKPILEIGSGSLGIAPYLNKEMVGLDFNFSGPQTSLLTKVHGSAVNLPFKDNSFDTVIMVDVLEHIAPKSRETAVFEAIRVVKDLLVIATPEGKTSEKEDRHLSDYYQKIYAKEFPFYKEHLTFGLPKSEWINATINKALKNYKKRAEITVQNNVSMVLHR